jgi:hypothetical protein
MESISQKVVSNVTYNSSNNFVNEITVHFEDTSSIKFRISEDCCEFSAFYKPNLDKLIGNHIVNIDLIQGEIPFIFKGLPYNSSRKHTPIIEENIIYSSAEECEIKTYRIFMDNVNEHIDLCLFTLSNGYYSGHLVLSDEHNRYISPKYSPNNKPLLTETTRQYVIRTK